MALYQIADRKHFTLYKLTDIKQRVKQATRWLRHGGNNRLITLQTDVKQMYTNLDHVDIKKAITWLLDIVIQKNNKRKRDLQYFIMDKSEPFNIHMSRSRGLSDQYTFTRKDILKIIDVDLNNTYQGRGKEIFIQTKGCPMGGLLSAIYANVKCAHDEARLIHNLGTYHKNVYGIRQMDDLILWIAYDQNKSQQIIEAHERKNNFPQSGLVYTGP